MFAHALQLVVLAALQLHGAVVQLPPPPGVAQLPFPLALRDASELHWVRHDEHVAPVITARAALVLDPETGAVLYARHPGSRVAIASLTKLAAALVVLDAAPDLDRTVRVPPDAHSIEGTRNWLVIGDHYRVRDLLAACLVSSAADGTLALADAFGETSRDSFVQRMNARARSLGLSATFANPVGIDDPDAAASAADVAALLVELWRTPLAREFLGTQQRTVTSEEGRTTVLESTNGLLGAEGFTILAGKTGTTDEAGQAFAAVGSVDGGRPLLTVVLGSTNRFKDTRVLLAWSAVAWSPPF